MVKMQVLDPAIEYPFRASLTKIARCGMCENTIREGHGKDGDLVIDCTMGLELIYPLITGEHKCKLYEYKPIPKVKVPKNKLKIFVGLIVQLKECKQCSHNLQGYCDGIEWFPFETDPRCKFFRDKNLICKYAIPYFQYGSTMRNNYCQLEPEKRDGDNKRGWKWNCPNAHKKSAEYYKCYESFLKSLLILSKEAYRYQQRDICHYRYLESLEEIIEISKIKNFVFWKNLAISIINDWEKKEVPTVKSHNNLRKLIKSIKKKIRESKGVEN